MLGGSCSHWRGLDIYTPSDPAHLEGPVFLAGIPGDADVAGGSSEECSPKGRTVL